MMGWRNKYQILFITLISFGALIFPTYCLFYSLDKADFFRSPHLENPVQEDLLANVEKELTGLGWMSGGIISSQGKGFLQHFPDVFLNLLITEKVIILRC